MSETADIVKAGAHVMRALFELEAAAKEVPRLAKALAPLRVALKAEHKALEKLAWHECQMDQIRESITP